MNPVIKVFINPTCGPCLELKKWLNEKEISFIQKDIVNDEDAANEFKKMGGKFTPTTLIENGVEKFEVIGFNPVKIERILSLFEETAV
jgi:arsenate reductase-like glutaredoxin family protein